MSKMVKFNCFNYDRDVGKHNFKDGTYKIILSPETPCKDTTSILGIKEITSNGNYPLGGKRVDITVEQDGETSLVKGVQVVFEATDGAYDAFRYAILYCEETNALVCYWDYGVCMSLAEGKTFTIKFNKTSPGLMFTTK